MILINKAKKILEYNAEYDADDQNLELKTILNALRDPGFKQSISINQRKEDFYDYKSEEQFVAEYNEDPSWFFVFCKKSVKNIDLLVRVHNNKELAEQILNEIKQNYTKKEKVSLLYEEFKKLNTNQSFKAFFILFFQKAIVNLFKEFNIEIPATNLEPAYAFFIDSFKSKISMNEELTYQVSTYKDKDLFYIEALINQTSTSNFNRIY